MSGGGPSKTPAYQPVQQVQIQPVPKTQLQTEGYGGMGYTQVPQTYTPGSAPSWMKGGTMDLGGQGYQGMGGVGGKAPGQTSMPNWYQMPQWGTNAVTGEALTQEQLQPAAYEPPPPPPPQQQQAPQAAPRSSWADYQRDRSIYRNTMNRLGAGTDDYNEMSAWNEFGGPWGAMNARDRYSKSNEYRYKPKSQWTMYDAQQAALRG